MPPQQSNTVDPFAEFRQEFTQWLNSRKHHNNYRNRSTVGKIKQLLMSTEPQAPLPEEQSDGYLKTLSKSLGKFRLAQDGELMRIAEPPRYPLDRKFVTEEKVFDAIWENHCQLGHRVEAYKIGHRGPKEACKNLAHVICSYYYGIKWHEIRWFLDKCPLCPHGQLKKRRPKKYVQMDLSEPQRAAGHKLPNSVGVAPQELLQEAPFAIEYSHTSQALGNEGNTLQRSSQLELTLPVMNALTSINTLQSRLVNGLVGAVPHREVLDLLSPATYAASYGPTVQEEPEDGLLQWSIQPGPPVFNDLLLPQINDRRVLPYKELEASPGPPDNDGLTVQQEPEREMWQDIWEASPEPPDCYGLTVQQEPLGGIWQWPIQSELPVFIDLQLPQIDDMIAIPHTEVLKASPGPQDGLVMQQEPLAMGSSTTKLEYACEACGKEYTSMPKLVWHRKIHGRTSEVVDWKKL